MEDPADGNSQNRPGWHLLDRYVATRNRKVVGSNPTSGSKKPDQWPGPLALLGHSPQLAGRSCLVHTSSGCPPGC